MHVTLNGEDSPRQSGEHISAWKYLGDEEASTQPREYKRLIWHGVHSQATVMSPLMPAHAPHPHHPLSPSRNCHTTLDQVIPNEKSFHQQAEVLNLPNFMA